MRLLLVLLFVPGVVWGKFPELTADESTRLGLLELQRAQLAGDMAQLSPLWSVGADPVEFLQNHREPVVEFSNDYFNYKVARLKLFTELVYRLACEAAARREYRSPTLDLLANEYAVFAENLSQIEVLQGSSGEAYKKARAGAAAHFDSINPSHRKIIDLAHTLRDELRGAPQGILPWLAHPFVLLRSFVSRHVDNALLRLGLYQLRAKRDVLWMLRLLMKLKFFLRGYSFVDEGLTAGLSAPLEKHQVNFIVAPHGGREEVALTAARIANALPKGRKAAVLLAAYHFVPQDEAGFALANSLSDHAGWIVVLADSSPFAGRGKSESFDTQIRLALEAGYTDVIVFSEGRLPPREGGLTPNNLMTFRIPNSIVRQTIRVDGVEKRLEPVFTVLSGTLSSAEIGQGSGAEPLVLAYEFRADAVTTKALAKEDPAGFASLVDVIWNARAYQANPTRLGYAADDPTLVGQLMDLYRSLDGDSCAGAVLESAP